MMKIKHLLFLLLTIIFHSCIFSPEGENFVEIDKNIPPPEIANHTLDFEKDTIFIWKNTSLNFDLSSSNQKILNVVITYADKTERLGPTGTFQIDPLLLTEGIHSLEMKVYTKSGTGSLADKLDAEQFEFSKKWTLVIIRQTSPDPSKPKIRTSIENGFLKFSWDKAFDTYFKSYKLTIINGGLMTSYNREFFDCNITSFIDSLFVGNNITAILDINYSVGENLRVQSQVDYSYPIAANITMDVDSVTLTWNRNPFQHRTFYSANNGATFSEIIADTSVTMISPGFGGPVQYYIGFMPLKQPPSNPYYRIYTLQSTFMTASQQKFNTLIYQKDVNSYVLKYSLYVRRLNKEFQMMGTYDYPNSNNDDLSSLDISKDGQKIYTIINHKFTVLNYETLAKIRECSPPPGKFDSNQSYILKYLNDSLLIVGMRYNYVIYNINMEKVVFEADFGKKYGDSSMDYYYAISQNAKYAAYCDKYGLKIYENIDNKELKLIYSDSSFHYNCIFDPANPHILIAFTQTNIYYFDCQTLKIFRTLDPKYGHPLNIDPSTNYLLLGSTAFKKMYIYDFLNDKILKEYNFRGNPLDYKLFNNTLYWEYGYYYKFK